MGGSPTLVGPFVNGLNRYSDPSAIGDNEVADIQNFDIDLDGSLVSRPPITQFDPGLGAFNNWFILGYFKFTDGKNYLLASNSNGAYYFVDGAWHLIHANGANATAYVQYKNKAFIVTPPGSSSSGFSWDPTAGKTDISTMPKGTCAVVYKERMFIGVGQTSTTNTSRLYFSPAGQPDGTWAVSTDFLEIKSGDGQDIIDITVFADSITVFKTSSTYIFAYDSSPTRGAVRAVNATIGTSYQHNYVSYENSLYVYADGSVFQITNWTWDKLNIKVPFKYVNTHVGSNIIPVTVSILGDRLVIRYYDKYYVYGFKTKAWTTWDSTMLVDQFIKNPAFDTTTGINQYFAGSVISTDRSLYQFKDGYDAVNSESMTCYVLTKTYDFNVPYTYKRLFFWGSDVLSKVALTALVTPVAYNRQVTWNDLKNGGFTWNDLLGHTWQQPLDVSINVSDNTNIVNVSGYRMFIKWLKSLRFRQVNFFIQGVTTGKSADAPIRIFKLTAWVANKELVSKKVN
jgi:hypothetical protein